MAIEANQQRIRSYLENRPAMIEALSYLREGIEIRFTVAGLSEGVVFRQGDQNHVEYRTCNNSDITFAVTLETASRLLAEPGIDLDKVVLFFLREMLVGNIVVKVSNNYRSLLTSGYIRFFVACAEKFGLEISKKGWAELHKGAQAMLDFAKKN